MDIKTIGGTVLFSLETAKTVMELVVAAVMAKKDLRGADFRGADLRGADLRGACLTGAYLTGADLRGAYLTGAYLAGAYLTGADLTGAYLRGAYLRGAYLRGAVIDDKKVKAMRVFSGLYAYDIWAVLFEDVTRMVRIGCLYKTLDEWKEIGILNSNLSEFPNDGSDRSKEREIAFKFARYSARRLE